MMNENDDQNGGGNGIDHDTFSDNKLCRDFIRNVCTRGKNCKFIHPENANVRHELTFCHDYQQGKCFRSTCKFVHCNREDEEQYKETGVIPPHLMEQAMASSQASKRGSKSRGGFSGGRGGGGGGNSHNGDLSDIPVCKDFLKGVCDRPPGGCKYRHVSESGARRGGAGGRGGFANPRGGGSPAGARGGFSRGGGTPVVNVPRRRSGSASFYENGPEAKRMYHQTYDTSQDEGYSGESYGNAPQVERRRPQQLFGALGSNYPNGNGNSNSYNPVQTFNNGNGGGTGSANGRNNGYNTGDVVPYFQSSGTSEAMKALEEENFMLKRRIEELKTSNEFLLSQNAQLRLNNSLSVSRSTVENVQNVQVPQAGGGVVQTLVSSMAQPIGLSSSLSVTPTQPLSTISTLPTVSLAAAPASISQTIPVVSIAQHQPQTVYSMVTTQGVLPAPPN